MVLIKKDLFILKRVIISNYVNKNTFKSIFNIKLGPVHQRWKPQII